MNCVLRTGSSWFHCRLGEEKKQRLSMRGCTGLFVFFGRTNTIAASIPIFLPGTMQLACRKGGVGPDAYLER